MKTYGKILSGILILSALSAGAVEAVPGVRGQGARINGDAEYLFDAKNKSFDFKAGVSVSFWVKGNSWAHQAGIIGGLGDTVISKRYNSATGSFYFNTRMGGPKASLLWAVPVSQWSNQIFAKPWAGTTPISKGSLNFCRFVGSSLK